MAEKDEGINSREQTQQHGHDAKQGSQSSHGLTCSASELDQHDMLKDSSTDTAARAHSPQGDGPRETDRHVGQ